MAVRLARLLELVAEQLDDRLLARDDRPVREQERRYLPLTRRLEQAVSIVGVGLDLAQDHVQLQLREPLPDPRRMRAPLRLEELEHASVIAAQHLVKLATLPPW